LTLRSNNLPETGKRQYENKGTHAPSRLDGVDRRTTRKKRIYAIILPRSEMQRIPTQCNIAKPIQIV